MEPKSTTPLLAAADRGDLPLLRQLLEEDPSLVDQTDSFGRNPLHYSARKAHESLCHELLSYGANLEQRTIHGCTPLYCAVLSAKAEVVELLADGYCADVNAMDLAMMTPLHVACDKGYADIVKCLLQLGADYQAKDSRGLTPLDWAVHRQHKECIAMLHPDHPILETLDQDDGGENGLDEYEMLRRKRIENATNNDGVAILKYPFTKENNSKHKNPYKVDIYDVY